MGRPSTKSSCAVSSGTASSKVRSLRTSQEPFRSAARKKFQPCAVGIMNTDVDAASISKLLPRDHLRNIVHFADHHLHLSRGAARFPDAHNAKPLVPECDHAAKLLKLFRRKAERSTHIIQACEWRVISRSIDPVRAAAQREKAKIGRASCRER